MQGWHLLSRNLYQDCFSNGSNGQIKQDMAVQHHQLCKQVQAVQVSCHLCGRETWTLLADSGKKNIQAFEAKCLRKLIRISNLEQKINDWVQSKINFIVGPQEHLLATVQRPKLA